jgi:hypothetical protein
MPLRERCTWRLDERCLPAGLATETLGKHAPPHGGGRLRLGRAPRDAGEAAGSLGCEYAGGREETIDALCALYADDAVNQRARSEALLSMADAGP